MKKIQLKRINENKISILSIQKPIITHWLKHFNDYFHNEGNDNSFYNT